MTFCSCTAACPSYIRNLCLHHGAVISCISITVTVIRSSCWQHVWAAQPRSFWLVRYIHVCKYNGVVLRQLFYLWSCTNVLEKCGMYCIFMWRPFVEMAFSDSVSSLGRFTVPVQTFNSCDAWKQATAWKDVCKIKEHVSGNQSVALLQERLFLEELVCIFKAWWRPHSGVNVSAPHTWLAEGTSCYAVIVASSSDFETAERDERITAVKQHWILSALPPPAAVSEKNSHHEQNKRFHFK